MSGPAAGKAGPSRYIPDTISGHRACRAKRGTYEVGLYCGEVGEYCGEVGLYCGLQQGQGEQGCQQVSRPCQFSTQTLAVVDPGATCHTSKVRLYPFAQRKRTHEVGLYCGEVGLYCGEVGEYCGLQTAQARDDEESTRERRSNLQLPVATHQNALPQGLLTMWGCTAARWGCTAARSASIGATSVNTGVTSVNTAAKSGCTAACSRPGREGSCEQAGQPKRPADTPFAAKTVVATGAAPLLAGCSRGRAVLRRGGRVRRAGGPAKHRG